MAGCNYYAISALPTLPDLGAPPPISPADLREHVKAHVSLRRPVDVLLVSDDLLQREALLAGEIEEVEPAVLSREQALGAEALPAELAPEEEPARRIPSDAVWAKYFRHAARVARDLGGRLLAGWVMYEVSLRNALVTARAKSLGLEPADYQVAPELGGSDEDFSAVVQEWAAAPNPLKGQQVLDRARWAWLVDHEAWFSFSDDEVGAYAAKLLLLVRWHRLTQEADDEERT